MPDSPSPTRSSTRRSTRPPCTRSARRSCAGAVLARRVRAGAIAALDARGGRLGLAFQLVDDLIGAFGSAEQAGRDAGGDLRESKRTPLIALARQTPARGRASTTRWRSPTPGPSPCAKRRSPSRRAGPALRLRSLIDDTLDDGARRRRTTADFPPAGASAPARAGRPVVQERDPVDATSPTGLALYDRTAQDAAAAVIAAYSTSFGLACRLLGPATAPARAQRLRPGARRGRDRRRARRGRRARRPTPSAPCWTSSRRRRSPRSTAGSARTSSCTPSPAPRGSAGSARTSSARSSPRCAPTSRPRGTTPHRTTPTCTARPRWSG